MQDLVSLTTHESPRCHQLLFSIGYTLLLGFKYTITIMLPKCIVHLESVTRDVNIATNCLNIVTSNRELSTSLHR